MAKIQITPDHNKAKALHKIAIISYQRLLSLPLIEFPSNTIIDYYDIYHKLLDAIFLCQGIKFKGDGAHYELIKESKTFCSESEVVFLQKLRELRIQFNMKVLVLIQSMYKEIFKC